MSGQAPSILVLHCHARVAIKGCIVSNAFTSRLQKCILLCMQAKALISTGDIPSSITTRAPAFIAIRQMARSTIIPVCVIIKAKEKFHLSVLHPERIINVPCPVAMIRRLRTIIAPTRRFMQFDRREARLANVLIFYF